MLHVCALHGLKFISASRNELLGDKGLDRRRQISFPRTDEKKGWLAGHEELWVFLATLQSDTVLRKGNTQELLESGANWKKSGGRHKGQRTLVQGRGTSWLHSDLDAGSLDHFGSDP